MTERQYVIDARTMAPGPLAKRYPAVAQECRTVKARAKKDGMWNFEGFNAFLLALGPPPSPEHTVDRFPRRTGCYEPGNVRWATRETQANNRSTNKRVTIDGESLTYAQAEKRFGLRRGIVGERKRNGWSDHDAVKGVRTSTPDPEPEGTSLIPAPEGWDRRLSNGRPDPYVPRIPQMYAEPNALPLEDWGEIFDQDILATMEANFQRRCEPGVTRADRMLAILAELILCITRHCDPHIAKVRDRLAELQHDFQYSWDGDPQTGGEVWSDPDRSQEELDHLCDRLTARLDKMRARRAHLLAPYIALRDDLARRRDEGRLPTFWRSVARLALRTRRPLSSPLPSAGYDDDDDD